MANLRVETPTGLNSSKFMISDSRAVEIRITIKSGGGKKESCQLITSSLVNNGTEG